MSKLPESGPHTEGAPSSLVRRYLVAFGHFWWEFLVGDTPELLVGAVLAVAIVALFAHHGVARAVTVSSLPVLVIAMLGASVRRARRASSRARRDASLTPPHAE